MSITREYSLNRNERTKSRGPMQAMLGFLALTLLALGAWILIAPDEEELARRARAEDFKSLQAFEGRIDLAMKNTLNVGFETKEAIKIGAPGIPEEELQALLDRAIAAYRLSASALASLARETPEMTDKKARRLLAQSCTKLALGVSHQAGIFSDLKFPEEGKLTQEYVDHLVWNSEKVDIIIQSAFADLEAARKSVAPE